MSSIAELRQNEVLFERTQYARGLRRALAELPAARMAEFGWSPTEEAVDSRICLIQSMKAVRDVESRCVYRLSSWCALRRGRRIWCVLDREQVILRPRETIVRLIMEELVL